MLHLSIRLSSHRLVFIDGFVLLSNDELRQEIQSALSLSPEPCVVMFDSLTAFLLSEETTKLCQYLYKLKSGTTSQFNAFNYNKENYFKINIKLLFQKSN